MSLDVWFRDDIRRVLYALDEASRAAQAHASTGAPISSYRAGYSDAMRAVAIAFGIIEMDIGDGSETAAINAAQPALLRPIEAHARERRAR